jgi:hypothetical protein
MQPNLILVYSCKVFFSDGLAHVQTHIIFFPEYIDISSALLLLLFWLARL